MKKTHQQLERNSTVSRNDNQAIEQLYADPRIKQFVAERDRVLLSLDEAAIRKHNNKWHVRTPDDPVVFWIGIHKARTACLSLPREARLLSKMWLMTRGYQSLDDGDLELELAVG